MERYTKAKFRMKISYFTKEDEGLKLVDSKIETCRGSDFMVSLATDQAKGIKRKIEYVDKEPEAWSMGTIYILRDGTKAWVYTELVPPADSDISKE